MSNYLQKLYAFVLNENGEIEEANSLTLKDFPDKQEEFNIGPAKNESVEGKDLEGGFMKINELPDELDDCKPIKVKKVIDKRTEEGKKMELKYDKKRKCYVWKKK